jgi:ATP:corrinoid adenosyltransferase
MQTYLYTGSERSKAVQRLAISTAAMKQPTLVIRFGGEHGDDALDVWSTVLPVEVVQVRLPGLDWPLSHTPADELAVQSTVAILAQMIASDSYRLVILDDIRKVVSGQLLDEAQLKHLVRSASASGQTQIAMT